MNHTIGEILESRSSSIWSVRSQQSVLDAIRLMAEKSIGAVPVIDDERLVGIFSERDYARKVVLENRSSDDTPVADIMTKKVTTVRRDSSIAECMAMMTQQHFRHLPVVERRRVLGIISIGDLVKAVIKQQQFTIDQLQQYIAS